MAGAFPLPELDALDALVRAHLPLALMAEQRLLAGAPPRIVAWAWGVLHRNSELRALRRRVRAAAGVDDIAQLDGFTGDAGDACDGGGW